MVRTQVQLTEEQAKWLKDAASRRKKSMAELIRGSVDELISREGKRLDEATKRRAIAAAGFLNSGPPDLARNHDKYLLEVYED